MRRPASISMLFASEGGCRGFPQVPREGAPTGRLVKMSTTVENRRPGLESRWLRYDDGLVDLRFEETRIRGDRRTRSDRPDGTGRIWLANPEPDR